ncbi:glutathione synthetase, ATP-grasp domain [Cyclonatronum proteinivorum]|uniref:Glutathione synthetase, ATP-grasp domain n=1 Tax=Cyclonatronum proteinivorum TaxID=1457365 RepID=A0A345ULH9_9BACT|nr:hypothetical protein [Cyclonatronum proteinivorum]AXJ01331.1 glutathione synthetase, ATP-grasp domain [Cyclonatronum proteinivorum]
MTEQKPGAFLADVALLTEHRYEAAEAAPDDWYLGNMLRDDALLQAALQKRGLSAVRIDWARKDVDWRQFRCAVFRTTWDYYERSAEFSDWLDRVKHETLLINPAEMIRWNMDKHYLADLDAKGVNIVPSVFMEAGSQADKLVSLMQENGWSKAVVKPCISGGAWHTYRVSPENAAAVSQKIAPVLQKQAFMLQPFMQSIVESGEDTLMVLNGAYTHAVRKRAAKGDFRVQDDWGGTVEAYTPSPAQIELAERAMAAVTPVPVYGRADMVRDGEGNWAIMELELLEPELWIRYHEPSAEPFADGIVNALHAFESGRTVKPAF